MNVGSSSMMRALAALAIISVFVFKQCMGVPTHVQVGILVSWQTATHSNTCSAYNSTLQQNH